ncbi:MAG: hypothetical protein ACLPX9_02685 [Rhodomicrobium sp.]
MLGHNREPVPLALFEGFEKDNISAEAIDEFKSALIVAYEQALQDGINPGFALGTMLDWVSLEVKRYTRLRSIDR